MNHGRIILIGIVALGVAGCPRPEPAESPNITEVRDAREVARPESSVPTLPDPIPEEPDERWDMWTSWFTSAELLAALEAYREGRNAEAAAAFEAKAGPDEAGRAAAFMALLSHHDAGHPIKAAEPLMKMADRWPLLSDYCWYYAGRAYLALGDAEQARQALSRVTDSSTLWVRASEQLALSWRALGRPDRAIAVLETVTSKRPDAKSSCWLLLRQLIDKAGLPERVRDIDRELATRFSRSPEGQRARTRLGAAHGLTPEQLYQIGLAAYGAQEHRKALKAFETVLKVTSKGEHLNCSARTKIARTLEKMKKRKRAWSHYVKVLSCRGEPLADATFAGGRNRLRAGEPERAIRLLTRHVNAFPERSTVDDALVMVAQAQRALDAHDAADETLRRILREHPRGDLVDDATWALLWPRIESRRYREAVRVADEILKHIPRERSYRAEGRTLYWRARALDKLGESGQATQGYHAVLRSYPLSWYAVLAYSRLHHRSPADASRALEVSIEASSTPADPLARLPASLIDVPHWHKAVALARLGLRGSAKRELDAIALPREDREATWAKVALYAATGSAQHATYLARQREPYFGAHYPKDSHRRLWELAHPRGFAGHVSTWAEARAIDPFWVWSIIREESGFNPRIESWANAVGLMQLIMPTAKSMAKGTPHTVNGKTLRDPAINIELGTRYLEKLLKRHPVLPLASAGYNAGGGAVSKWRRRQGDLPLDEFVERIPYREARGYAKRVTRSVARYRWLYGGGEMMTLDLSPPGRP